MILSLQCVSEASPGEKWQTLFQNSWPAYKEWFLTEGLISRKGYLTSATMLRRCMPEIYPLYEKLSELAGGGDIQARFLSMYCPPPYMAGCSQIAWNHGDLFLIRNYDYSPELFEGAMLYTNYLKPVIGLSDCCWGLLDGMNGDGLAASLAFGGRNICGEGFGIPLIMRYILETCTNTREASEKLAATPCHMSYNVTLLDATGNYATVFLAPDKPPVINHSAVGTNHQENVDWLYYEQLTATRERIKLLENYHSQGHETKETLTNKFLHPPLYCYNYQKNFGTLYTARYDICERELHLIWPDSTKLVQSFANFSEEKISVHLSGGNLKREYLS